MLARRATIDEMARSTGVRPILLQRLVELGVIPVRAYYTEAELRELRRACRLIDDLGFEAEAAEVLLRMRQRILLLQREVARLRAERRRRQVPEEAEASGDIVDAETFR